VPVVRALVWTVEDTWTATVAEAATFLCPDAEVTLLHVAATEPETVAVDHAPCQVLLVWPDVAPAVATIPPPPPR
jgi:hypothetical protein